MPIRLDSRADAFAARFAAFLGAKREAAGDGEGAVRGIIDAVKARGDAALVELTNKFDRTSVTAAALRVTKNEMAAGGAACEPAAPDSLVFTQGRVEAYHRRQLPRDGRFTDALGVELGSRWTAIA